jgi:N-dimethylarginine dimethylaminohydrolase
MCSPEHFSCESPINYWMKQLNEEERKINKSKAMEQWSSLYNILCQNSIVYLLPEKPSLQDQVFTANIGFKLPERDVFIISNFLNDERKGEEFVAEQFLQYNYTIETTKNIFEGEADVKIVGKNILIGYGIRTSFKVIDEIKKIFKKYDLSEYKIIPIKMTSDKSYHFDTCVLPINEETILINKYSIDSNDVDFLKKSFKTRVIPLKYWGYYGCTNSIINDSFLLNGTDLNELIDDEENYDFEKRRLDYLSDLAYKFNLLPIFINISEFHKSGADLSCLVCRL